MSVALKNSLQKAIRVNQRSSSGQVATLYYHDSTNRDFDPAT